MDQNIFIEHIRRGEPAALERLVVLHRDQVYRTCLGYVQKKEDAEDLTQEVFIKVIENIDKFKGKAKLLSWIIRIAINLSVNYVRDNKKRLNQFDSDDLMLEEERGNDSDRLLIKRMVRKAIYTLPEKQQKVFVLSHYIQLSYAEIAEVTGFSISSIESLLFRARKNLRIKLSDFYNELVS